MQTGSTPMPFTGPVPFEDNEHSEEADKQRRTRIRIPTSCSICRKRKIKCDKAKPVCGGCAKSNVGHLCQYGKQPWVPDSLKAEKQEVILPPPGSRPSSISNETVTSSTYMGLDISDLPPHARKAFKELRSRVKHLEASIAVHDLSNPKPNEYAASQNPTPSSFQTPGIFPVPSPASSFNFKPCSNGPAQFLGSEGFQRDFRPLYDFNPDLEIKLFGGSPFFIKKARLISHGPTSVLATMRKDPYLKVLWIQVWKQIEKSYYKATGKTPALGVQKECFSKYLSPDLLALDSDNNCYRCITSFLDLRRQKLQEKAEIKELLSANQSLEEKVLEILPNAKAIVILTMRFFKNVYPFMPFIEENMFFSDFNHLFGGLNFREEKFRSLNLESKHDYATLGLLLMVLRFGYLSLSEEEMRSNKDWNQFINDPITSKFVALGIKCLEHYNFLRKPYGLKVIQLALSIKLYYRFCPEDDNVSDGSSSSIMLGTLFSMAYSIGLNRDPRYLTQIAASQSSKDHSKIWKKIWYTLLELDSTTALQCGTPLSCSDDSSYDTPLPELDPLDDATDSYISREYRFIYEKTKLYRQIFKKCFNIKRSPSALDVIRSIKSLENFATSQIGSFKDILNDTKIPKFAQVKKISYLIEMRSLILDLQVTLLGSFELVGDLKKTFEYSCECLKSILKIANSSMNLVYNETFYFGPGFSFVLRPSWNLPIFKSSMFLIGINAKLLHSHKRLSNLISKSDSPSSVDLEKLKTLHLFSRSVVSNLQRIFQLLAKLSSRQYNFSKICMMMRLFIVLLEDPAYDFEKIANSLATAQDGLASSEMIPHLRFDEIPKSNFFDAFLAPELNYLMNQTESDIISILQPAISTKGRSENPSTSETNGLVIAPSLSITSTSDRSHDSFSSTNQPLNAYEQSATFNDSAIPSYIDPDNIFGFDMSSVPPGPKGNIKQTDTSSLQTSTSGNGSSSSVLTCEEYASLFGIFDDYKGLE